MASSAPASPAQIHESIVERNVMVTMRDGTRLATDIYYPAREGRPLDVPFPVVLERTPYGKAQPSRSEMDRNDSTPMSRAEVATEFVARGYVVVYQDCRGRYGSEGKFVKYLSEGEDGVDTISWIREQPWCDGRVAMMGLSYAAHTQVAPACLAPEGLAALVVDSGGFSNAYHSGIRQGGALEMKQWTWGISHAKESVAAKRDPLVRAALDREDIHAWFSAMPWKRGYSPLSAVPEYEDYVFDQWRNGTFGPFWRQLGIYAEGYYDTFADVPQVYVSSWYDVYVKSATDNFVGLKKGKRGPVRLIMGPWLHGDRNIPHSGDVDFGEAACFDGNVDTNWRTFRRRWFDHWIKGEANGVDAEPAVRLFLMGGGSGRRNADGRFDHGGRWIAAADWPLPGTRFVRYYLDPEGLLSSEEPAADAQPLSYDFDPANPVPTIGGALTSGRPVFSGGAFDQREETRFFGCTHPGLPLAARRDVLVFQTPPLKQDMAVIGPIKVHLHVSSDCLDTDFTAKLVVVHPPTADDPQGFAMNLTDGILRCRYRDSFEAPSFMEPGKVYQITIEPLATCNLFKAGQRIRLDIASSNFPKFDVNPNTGEPEGVARRRRAAVNTVHMDRVLASHIVLPVVPISTLKSLGRDKSTEG